MPLKTKNGTSISKRLSLGFGLILFLFFVQIGAAIWLFHGIQQLESKQNNYILPNAELASDGKIQTLKMAVMLRNYLVFSDSNAQEEFWDSMRTSREAIKQLVNSPKEADDQALFNDIPELAERNWRAAEELSSLVPQRNEEKLAERERQLSKTRDKLLKKLKTFYKYQQAKLLQNVNALQKAEQRFLVILLTIGGVIIILGSTMAFHTISAIRRPIEQLVNATRALQRGEFEPARMLPVSNFSNRNRLVVSELHELAESFISMSETLQQRERRLTADSRLLESLSSSLDTPNIVDHALQLMINYSESAAGVIYLVDMRMETLQRLATYALSTVPETIQFGEGIPGEAVNRRQTIMVQNIPSDTPFQLFLGVDRIPPRAILSVPIIFGDELLGVVVLASLREIDKDIILFTEYASRQLGVSLKNAFAHNNVAQLARELEDKNQSLESQAEVIQAQNEELQSQAEELQTQNEKLHSQAEELQAQNEELHQMNRALQESKERAQCLLQDLKENDHQKDQFLAMLAHELRNPLGALSNAVYLLGKMPMDKSRQLIQIHEIMARQVKQQTRLLDDLLDTSRMVRGLIELKKELLDVTQLVKQAIDDHRNELEENNRQLLVTIEPQALWVNGDPARLTQVVSNLLDNAYKFTRAGDHIEVTVAADVKQQRAVVTVKDTGAGIDPILLPKIFSVFTQAEPSLDRKRGGLGLGLALVKGLVELHGGGVNAHSEGRDQGAEFSFWIPLQLIAENRRTSEDDTHSNQQLSQGSDSTNQADSRILIIEDNQDAATSLQDLLELHGYYVEIAYSGPSGIEAARKFKPEIILCDLGLPEMDGYAVARELRKDPLLNSVRLIAISGYGQAEYKQMSKEAGFDLHLIKPVAVDVLRGLLAKLAHSSQ